ncbi:glycosyltransferase family 4 protein [Blastococcus sp. KM273128]|uniref:glycosyltransferase family 4 protein n=1 Tax=Blastococcus sp. KM273128 TaxID=2570314 RepID=UPI001F45FEBE|nr:glycosyltransferase family 4 protein [Blastococcus sp. KM273128]
MSGGTRSYEFARRLVQSGHQVAVIAADPRPLVDGSRDWYVTVEAGVQVHWVPVPYDNAMRPWRRILAFATFLLAACRRAARLPQDVVFATSTPLTVAIPGAWSATRNSVPFVLEVRDLWPTVPIAMGALRSWPSRKVAFLLERWAYGRAAEVIALSPDMANGVRKVRPNASITVIPNAADRDLFGVPSGVDEQLALENSWLAERRLILYAGTFGRVNGVNYLVDVAGAMKDKCPEAVFVLIGGGAEFERVHQRARDLQVLGRNCFIFDRIPKHQIVAWFRRASVVVSTVIDVPELSANSANKVFDGLAAGRPVAVNHGGWIAEALREAGAGLELSRDPAVAADQLATFLSSEERIASASAAARQLAAEDFDRNKLAVSFEAVLTKAVQEAK